MIQSSFRRFKRSWVNQTQLQIATTSVLAATFTLLMVAWSLFNSLSEGLDSFRSDIQVTAYLSDEFKAGLSKETKAAIESQPEVESIQFVSADAAMKKFKERMADHLPEMFFSLEDENPLPSTVEIQLKDQVLKTDTKAKVSALAETLKSYPGVEDVSFGFNWAEQYSKVTRAFRMSGIFMILVLLLGGVFVIGNSVSQSVHQKRDEIEILELFGATRRSILIPFVVEGALTGLLAGVFALIFSAAVLIWLKEVIADEIGFIGVFGAFDSLGFSQSLLALILCTFVGGLGAFVFINRITTGWSAAQRGEA